MNLTKDKILKEVDKLCGYEEKLRYLNSLFLRARTKKQEALLMDMISDLNFYGR